MSSFFKFALTVAFLSLLTPAGAMAEDITRPEENFRSTDLPLPRYVTLRSDKVYVRTGPGLKYPVKWIFRRSGMPVEILQEFDNWRQVRGIDGDEGWVHQSLLSGERRVLIKESEETIALREASGNDARTIARLEPLVVASIDKCSGGWCRIEADGYRGWVERNFLWGIYDDEEFN